VVKAGISHIKRKSLQIVHQRKSCNPISNILKVGKFILEGKEYSVQDGDLSAFTSMAVVFLMYVPLVPSTTTSLVLLGRRQKNFVAQRSIISNVALLVKEDGITSSFVLHLPSLILHKLHLFGGIYILSKAMKLVRLVSLP